MERSAQLVKQLEEVRAKLEELKRKQSELVRDPSVRERVMDVLAGEMLNLSYRVMEKMRRDIKSTADAMDAEVKKAANALGEVVSDLRNMTKPKIAECVEALLELRKTRKLSREILEKSYDGLRTRWLIKVRTNQKNFFQIRDLVDRGSRELEGMADRPLPEIEEAYQEIRKSVISVDWQKEEILTIDESDYLKADPPATCPESGFSGSLLGMPFQGPPKKVSDGMEEVGPSDWFRRSQR